MFHEVACKWTSEVKMRAASGTNWRYCIQVKTSRVLSKKIAPNRKDICACGFSSRQDQTMIQKGADWRVSVWNFCTSPIKSCLKKKKNQTLIIIKKEVLLGFKRVIGIMIKGDFLAKLNCSVVIWKGLQFWPKLDKECLEVF